MTGKALICKLGEIQDIEGADRIGKVEMFGETLVVSKDYEVGELGILFDCETQLSHEYCHHNNLYREANLNKDDKTGYIDLKRRVKPISLKGVKVSGLFMTIDSLNFITTDSSKYPTVGSEIDVFSGVEICSKYVPPQTQRASKKNKQGKARKKDLVPTFKEHFDTNHWDRMSHRVNEGDLITLTEKLHGTSFRCGNMPVIQSEWYLVVIQWILKFFFGKTWTPTSHRFAVGSRRVVKSIDGIEAEDKDHYYREDLWTSICTREFKGKLRKGETIYGEIVGYTPSGEAIMGTHSNNKLKSFLDKQEYKQFIDKFGEETRFSYGTDRMSNENLNKVFVYRITMTNEDGESIDLTWEQVKTRCEQLDVAHVPQLDQFIYYGLLWEDHLVQYINDMTEADSLHFPQHLNEGVAVRIDNGSLTPQIYKKKRWAFKVLEGIIKDSDQVDIEESN